MAYLIVSEIKCNETSGGQIQLTVGNKSLLPDDTEFNQGDVKTFDTWVDLGDVIAVDFFINLYDTLFSRTNYVEQFQIEDGLVVTQPFNYEADVWSDGDYNTVSGKYDVTYQVSDTPGGIIRVYIRRLARLFIELIVFSFLFVRNLFLSIALPIGRFFSKSGDLFKRK